MRTLPVIDIRESLGPPKASTHKNLRELILVEIMDANYNLILDMKLKNE